MTTKTLNNVIALRCLPAAIQAKRFVVLTSESRSPAKTTMGRVLEMAESSASAKEYEEKFVTRFGGQQEMELIPAVDKD